MRLALSSHVAGPRDEIEDRLCSNLSRVDSLVAAYEQRISARAGRSSVVDTDLLRAAVVFLHATLEDLVRSMLAARWLHATSPELFDRVRFVLPGDRRPEKLGVGDLALHLRDKTAVEIVADAVEGHLAHSNIGNIDDLVLALRRAGIGYEFLPLHAGELYGLMQRRHWIVHRADRNERSGPGHHAARSLRLTEVRRWRAHVEAICRTIIARM
ncbi:MAG TPA: hypothetical protein VG755_28100 [Nannocystaceae bacterium]|nr:hypothetical protein [Nannocystaceae bacterium]